MTWLMVKLFSMGLITSFYIYSKDIPPLSLTEWIGIMFIYLIALKI